MAEDTLTLNSEDWSPLASAIEGSYLTPPYPASFWYISSNNELTMALLPDKIPGSTLTYPYPASLWFLDETLNNTLNSIFLAKEIILPPEGGAFLNATKLEYVKIPKSVVFIGDEAFQGTQLKEVCLSRNCIFYREAFPEDCRIIYYEDMYDTNFNIQVGGVNSYRTTEYIVHDEESWDSEIP